MSTEAEDTAEHDPLAITGRDEDLIEAAYWKFDAERSKTGTERDAFKGQLRLILREERRSTLS